MTHTKSKPEARYDGRCSMQRPRVRWPGGGGDGPEGVTARGPNTTYTYRWCRTSGVWRHCAWTPVGSGSRPWRRTVLAAPQQRGPPHRSRCEQVGTQHTQQDTDIRVRRRQGTKALHPCECPTLLKSPPHISPHATRAPDAPRLCAHDVAHGALARLHHVVQDDLRQLGGLACGPMQACAVVGEFAEASANPRWWAPHGFGAQEPQCNEVHRTATRGTDTRTQETNTRPQAAGEKQHAPQPVSPEMTTHWLARNRRRISSRSWYAGSRARASCIAQPRRAHGTPRVEDTRSGFSP
jgi:hypothetical protein